LVGIEKRPFDEVINAGWVKDRFDQWINKQSFCLAKKGLVVFLHQLLDLFMLFLALPIRQITHFVAARFCFALSDAFITYQAVAQRFDDGFAKLVLCFNDPRPKVVGVLQSGDAYHGHVRFDERRKHHVRDDDRVHESDLFTYDDAARSWSSEVLWMGCANNTWMGCVRRRDQTKDDEKEQEEGWGGGAKEEGHVFLLVFTHTQEQVSWSKKKQKWNGFFVSFIFFVHFFSSLRNGSGEIYARGVIRPMGGKQVWNFPVAVKFP